MRVAMMAAVVGLAGAHVAIAQDAPIVDAPVVSRGFFVINGGYQLTTEDFTDGAVKRENAEDGRLDATYALKGGPAFDLAAGGVLWDRLGVGIGVSRFSVVTPSALSATIPHPFFFDQARSVSGEVADLKREELAVHVRVGGVVPVGTRVQVMVFFGPSFFRVKQDVITDFTFNESYPYDDASFRAATTTTASVWKAGFNAGSDVAFFFTRQVGVGATLQMARAAVELPGVLGSTHEVKVGGVQAGAGLRLRF